MKNGWDAMLDILVKSCHKDGNFKSCSECSYNYDDKYNSLSCLIELIERYNEKYNTNYKIIDYSKMNEIRDLLDEC